MITMERRHQKNLIEQFGPFILGVALAVAMAIVVGINVENLFSGFLDQLSEATR